eukprot:scaffold292827_cov34-Prasinocladus_malaysianus.AAC.3
MQDDRQSKCEASSQKRHAILGDRNVRPCGDEDTQEKAWAAQGAGCSITAHLHKNSSSTIQTAKCQGKRCVRLSNTKSTQVGFIYILEISDILPQFWLQKTFDCAPRMAVACLASRPSRIQTLPSEVGCLASWQCVAVATRTSVDVPGQHEPDQCVLGGLYSVGHCLR